ncbi:MAG TPA: EAL domain-containing protein [Kofleriaceae bacterium]|jgi:hypothetical protein
MWSVEASRYRVLFEQSPQPMWMYERATLRFLAVNEAAIRHYGYSQAEFLAMTIADIRPAEDVAALKDDVAHRANGLTVETWHHRKKDGTTIVVEVRANDFVLDDRPVRLIVLTDVTDRIRTQEALRKTEEQLRQAQKMEAIGRLAGGVAHDFNNILTVVQSYACFLEEALDATDARQADAIEIRRAAERAAAITRQLLAMSRQSAVSARSVDVNALIAGFLPMLRRLLGVNVALAVRSGTIPAITIDPGQLEQVLMNLAVNSKDAMPDGGRLSIDTRPVDIDDEAAALAGTRAGTYIEIAFTDSGRGMDAETKRRIFEPFFTTKETGKGTGLGLSIVHGIVSQAGGTISLYSEAGLGTTFRILLPVAGQAVTEAPAPAPPSPRTLPPLRVLVVDDQPNVRTVAARVLRDAGCQVLDVATAEEARKVFVQHEAPIDVALVDIVLPDGRGDELVQQLRLLRPATKFVYMSGYPAGALAPAPESPVELVAKPFTPAELRSAIARAAGPEHATRDDDASVEPVTVKDHARRRALVADDDDGVRRVVVRLLTRAGFEVEQVDSGYKAITALEKEPFDVVVSDVQMPDGGGLDLLRAVRRIDLDVPVLLVTGDPSVQAAAAAVEYGAFRYLTKPLDAPAFVKSVEHAARAHALARLRREAFNVSGTHAGVADRAGLEVRFDQAIEGMWMAFQPIVHASSGMPFGVESLVRTTEPSMPNPGALLDAATQLGRLPMIGRRVRRLSAEAVAARDDGVALFVNLHPEDLQDVDLIDPASPLTQIAPRVVLEVTERASLNSSPELAARIARLRRLGFRLAVDDIGAGYSGLTSFTELTPEIVKIDMSLVRDVHTSALKQRTISALCRLCHEVGTLVVGEGVETVEERDTLVALGCDLLQGYLIARPKRELP